MVRRCCTEKECVLKAWGCRLAGGLVFQEGIPNQYATFSLREVTHL